MRIPFVLVFCLLSISAVAAAMPINWSIYLSDSNAAPVLAGTMTYDATTQTVSTWSIMGFDGFSGSNPCKIEMTYLCSSVRSSTSGGSDFGFYTLIGGGLGYEQYVISLVLPSALPDGYGEVNIIPGMQEYVPGFGVNVIDSLIGDGRDDSALSGYLVSVPEPSQTALLFISMLGLLAWRITGHRSHQFRRMGRLWSHSGVLSTP